MAISARIQYIKKHRQRGDIKTVATHFELKYNTVRDIVNGVTNGPNRDIILDYVEKIICRRIKRQEKLKQKYLSKLREI